MRHVDKNKISIAAGAFLPPKSQIFLYVDFEIQFTWKRKAKKNQCIFKNIQLRANTCDSYSTSHSVTVE